MILSDLISRKIEENKKAGIYRKIPDMNEIRKTALHAGRNDDYACKTSKNKQGENTTFINLATNDYLNLAKDGRVKNAAEKAIESYGTSSSSSFLIFGHSEIHKNLEKSLCNFKGGYGGCILYPSGYQANAGVIKALAGISPLNTFITFDELSHASIIDGVISSGVKFKSFKHNDLNHLENILQKYKNKETGKSVKIIITEGIFSMDGDIPPLPGILDLAEKYNAVCMLDDAHATGTIGKKGGGSLDYHKLKRKPDIMIGTLGKALASHGAFVLADELTVDYLINFSRAFIFSTGLPPAAAAASLEAINIIGKNHEIVTKLHENSTYAGNFLKNSGLDILNSTTHIIPVLIGDERKAVSVEKMLLNEGIYLKAVRYPTVARGSARLRLSINAGISFENIKFALERIADAASKAI